MQIYVAVLVAGSLGCYLLNRKQLWKIMKIKNWLHKMSIKNLYKITKTNKDTFLGLISQHKHLFWYSASQQDKRMTQYKLTL